MANCRNPAQKGNHTESNKTDVSSYDSYKEGAKIYYSGKAAYLAMVRTPRLDSTDLKPLKKAEVVQLEARVFDRQDHKEALKMIRQFADPVQVDSLNEIPFQLALVGSGIPDNYDIKDKNNAEELQNARTELFSMRQKRQLDDMVRSAYHNLRRNYFTLADSMPIVPVYLVGIKGGGEMRGYNEYVEFTKQLHFRKNNFTVSYYNALDNSIVCWMGSGGGSLSHEMGHAMMRYDFLEAPAWLSEGIASLYESTEGDYKPIGNYRLYYIQTAKNKFHSHISLCNLLSLSSEACNNSKLTPVYCAYARYFALFLHQSGHLKDVYQEMRDSAAIDPDDELQTLERLLKKSRNAIEKDWWAWLDKQTLPTKWQQTDMFITVSSVNQDANWSGKNCTPAGR
jgi:hypothetical protein